MTNERVMMKTPTLKGNICQHCRRFFETDRGSYQASLEKKPVHADLHTFKESWSLGCVICRLLGGEDGEIHSQAGFDSEAHCTGRLMSGNMMADGVGHVRFRIKSETARRQVELWVQRDRISTGKCPQTSDSKLWWFKDRYDRCRNLHKDCRGFQQDSVYRPRRLIDVGTETSAYVRLIETKDTISSKPLPYFTLSHCWGNSATQHRLLKDNLAVLKQGIAPSQLSQTFLDAIEVTRKLGTRFLWIDSLCIIQDSREDWDEQAPLMAQIYGSAMCCIAATWASGGEGLYSELDEPLAYVDCNWPSLGAVGPVKLWRITSFDEYIEKALLNQRAWVCQERLLSTRVMHFAKGRLFWECKDDGDISSRIHADTGEANMFPAISAKRSIDLNRLFSGNYETWRRLCELYSALQLTYEEDRIVALAGLAARVAKRWRPLYVAGIFMDELAQNLNWHVAERYVDRLRRKDLPSFSWASVPARIEYHDPRRSGLDDRESLIEGHLRTTGSFPITHVYTERHTGTALLISGQTFRVSVRGDDVYLPSNIRSDEGILVDLGFKRDEALHMHLDDENDKREFYTGLLLLWKQDGREYAALLLEEVGQKEFRRVGRLSFRMVDGFERRDLRTETAEVVLI